MARNREETLSSTNKPDRPDRTPLHDQKDKINIKEMDPNYHYRWVTSNNPTDPDRVERFKRGGYEVVGGNVKVGDSTVEDLTTRSSGAVERYMGQGQKAVLMRIRRDWYEEDQAAKQKEIDALEQQMKREALQDRYGRFSIERR